MRLSTFAAEPRLVELGGIPVMAAKLRVKDLAYLETWMSEAIPEPGPDDDIPGGWPPTFDTEAGLALVSSGEGVARLAFVSLRQTVAGMTVEQAREIVSDMAPDEFAPFYAAIFPAADEDDAPPGGERPRANWHARINHVAGTYHYTPGQILDLPLDQFFALGREPEREKPRQRWAIPVNRPEDLDRLWAERQASRPPGGG